MAAAPSTSAAIKITDRNNAGTGDAFDIFSAEGRLFIARTNGDPAVRNERPAHNGNSVLLSPDFIRGYGSLGPFKMDMHTEGNVYCRLPSVS